jgi:hypothetical protein
MSFFTRKYPVSQSNILLDCAMYGAIVFLILYVLQPFGVNMYKGNKFLVSLLFGAITFGCCYLFELAIKPLHKKNISLACLA